MAAQDDINRTFREFRRYTGDGLPSEPAAAALPIGDPTSGPHQPSKAELRDTLGVLGTLLEEAIAGGFPLTAGTLAGALHVDYDKATAGITYGYTAEVAGTSTPTDHVVAAQLNAFSKGSATRNIWGIACEAWTGDSVTAPTVGSHLIGIEPAVVSQYHASNHAIVGVDVVFKNRPDGATAAKGGLGSNGYNRNTRALYITSQARGTDTAYCGWRYGIMFEANSLDRTVDGLAVGINFVPMGWDAARHAGVIHMADDQKILLDTAGVRKFYYSSGQIAWDNNGAIATYDGTGYFSVPVAAGFKVGSNQIIGARATAWAPFTGAVNKSTTYATGSVTLVQLAERVAAIQAAMVTHGLIGP